MDAQGDREILVQEDRLTDATRNIDVDTLDGLYAEDIIFTGVTGAICDKRAVMDEARRGLAARLAAASSDAMAVVAYDKDEIRAIRHGDTAVASFRFGVTIRGDGQEVVRRYRTTNVWMKRSDRWQVVAAHTAALG
ncbi:MAG TPA: nuclear transport factor 2 family protein [Vicinamibacterales bacterium]|nr:nuclear transport factor 2 family protein [Vicinamibacterales bacterium]